MKKNKEEIELVKEWLQFARENLLFAGSGMKENFSPYNLPFESISQNDAKEAIEAANKIKKFVLNHINFSLNNK